MGNKLADFNFSFDEKKLLDELFDFTLNPIIAIDDPEGDREIQEVWDNMDTDKVDSRILGYLDGWILESDFSNKKECRLLKDLKSRIEKVIKES